MYYYYSSILSFFSTLLAFKRSACQPTYFYNAWLSLTMPFVPLKGFPFSSEKVSPFHSKNRNCQKSSQNTTITRLLNCRKSTRRLCRGKDSSTNRTRGFRRLVETSFYWQYFSIQGESSLPSSSCSHGKPGIDHRS